jgi:hypothetical protein
MLHVSVVETMALGTVFFSGKIKVEVERCLTISFKIHGANSGAIYTHDNNYIDF